MRKKNKFQENARLQRNIHTRKNIYSVSEVIKVRTVEPCYSIIFLLKKYMDMQTLKAKKTHSKS